MDTVPLIQQFFCAFIAGMLAQITLTAATTGRAWVSAVAGAFAVLNAWAYFM